MIESIEDITIEQLILMVEDLPEEAKERVITLTRALNERMYYQVNPIQWIEDKLGIKKETIKWSLNEGYEELESPRVMDDGTIIDKNGKGWDGTPDPLSTTLEGLAMWRDVVVQSSTGTGKTFLAALVTLWFLDVFPNSKVFTAAPKEDQLKDNLWGEIRSFKETFRNGTVQKKFMALKIDLDDKWFAKGVVAAVSKGEEVSDKTAGAHAEHMLWILDETQGIAPSIIAAIENTCTAPHNLRLFLGNPRHKEDMLHQTFLRPDFVSVQVSSYDHPNIVLNDPNKDIRGHTMHVPGAVSWKSIKTRRTLYGPEPRYYNNNAKYKALVRGEVPAGAELSIFTEKTLEMIDAFLEKEGPIPVFEKIHRPKDDKVLEGFTRIYKYPEFTHINRYVLFGDVAEDAGTGDWHACVVLDRITMEIVALIHMRGHRIEYASEILAIAKKYRVYDPSQDGYNNPVVNWERNAGGALHLIDDFMKYPNLFMARNYKSADNQQLKKHEYGWFTHGKSRVDMMNELEDWGYTLLSMLSRVPDEAVLKEMKTLVWNEKRRRFEHMSGTHDDIMLALSGALMTHKLLPDPVAIENMQVKKSKEHPHKKAISNIERRIKRRKRRRSGETSWDKANINNFIRRS